MTRTARQRPGYFVWSNGLGAHDRAFVAKTVGLTNEASAALRAGRPLPTPRPRWTVQLTGGPVDDILPAASFDMLVRPRLADRILAEPGVAGETVPVRVARRPKLSFVLVHVLGPFLPAIDLRASEVEWFTFRGQRHLGAIRRLVLRRGFAPTARLFRCAESPWMTLVSESLVAELRAQFVGLDHMIPVERWGH